MKVNVIAVVLSSLYISSPNLAMANASTLKVVMQINGQNEAVIFRAIRDANEIHTKAEAEGTKLDMKLVVYGSALDQFDVGGDPELKKVFMQLTKSDGVQIFASEDTLKRIHKSLKNLLPEFTTISSGPLRVLELERDGYLYIKPWPVHGSLAVVSN